MEINDNYKTQNQYLNEEEIDLKEFFLVLWQGKLRVILITFVASIMSVYFALSLPNIYKSEAILAPVDNEDSSLSSLKNQMGGIVSFSGITLPAGKIDNASLGICLLYTSPSPRDS